MRVDYHFCSQKPLPPSDDSQVSREITEEEENENCKIRNKGKSTVNQWLKRKTSDVGYVGFDGALQYKKRVKVPTRKPKANLR
jgi:hypothetical protein